MNVLQLGQMLQSQVGASADLPLAGPSTFNGATGQYLEFFNWLRMSYRQIQEEQLWNWRTKQGTMQLCGMSNSGVINSGSAALSTTDAIFDQSMVGASIRVNGAGVAGAVLVTTISTFNSATSVTLATNASTSVNPANVYVAGKYVFSVADVQKQTDGLIQAPLITTQTAGPTNLVDYEDMLHLHFIDDQRYGLVWDLAVGVADQTFCRFIPYQDWRGWKDRNVLPAGKPAFYTRRPDLSLEFNPIPNKPTYCFSMDYKTVLDDFPVGASGNQPSGTSDAYVPTMPALYHEAIVWRSLMFWAMQRQNPAKYDVAKNEYQKIMNQMYAQYLPEVNIYAAEFYGGY